MASMSRVLLTLLLAFGASAVSAAQYEIDQPVPPGAQGTVVPYYGEVLPLVGIGLAVAGRVDPMAAALGELGAKVTETEIRIEMSADVLFDFDKSIIKPAAEPALMNVATVLRGYPGAAVAIYGHTDGKGSATYNQGLSERRAQSVQTWLVQRAGLRDMRFSIQGWGAQRPVAPNTDPNGADNPEGRQKNRRVEIVVAKR